MKNVPIIFSLIFLNSVMSIPLRIKSENIIADLAPPSGTNLKPRIPSPIKPGPVGATDKKLIDDIFDNDDEEYFYNGENEYLAPPSGSANGKIISKGIYNPSRNPKDKVPPSEFHLGNVKKLVDDEEEEDEEDDSK